MIDKIKSLDRPYIIAELGSNYRNDEDLVHAINLSKSAGADAIKYQYFDESELFGPTPKLAKHIFPRLKEKANAVGIDLIASSFSPEGLKEIDPYVDAHKIASCEMSHLRLLEAAKATGKPLILSTGAHGFLDIQRAIHFFGDYPLVVMHCNVSYPARYTEYSKFKMIKCLHDFVGYSDHTTNIDVIPLSYAANGAKVIEKHFNPFDLKDTPDAPHSLNQREFTVMCELLKGINAYYSEENEAMLKHIRRVIALVDINPGDVIVEGVNVGAYRSRENDDRGISPMFMDKLNGRTALVKINNGNGISFSDVK